MAGHEKNSLVLETNEKSESCKEVKENNVTSSSTLTVDNRSAGDGNSSPGSNASLSPSNRASGRSSKGARKSPKGSIGRKGTNEKLTDKDFLFGRLIGEGSFSSVYLAMDRHSNQELAIKTCEKRFIMKEKKASSIMREKEVMNILNDNYRDDIPFFVKLFATFQSDSKLYFGMTLCKNGELYNRINNLGNFELEVSRFYTGEILRALEHLHSLNIIHRDLKPENILLDENNHIKITDFGSAKILPAEDTNGGNNEDSRRRSSFVGTAQYVSPEVIKTMPIDRTADLWALGCVLYQMISGLPPFRENTEYLILQSVCNLKYTFPDGFHEDAKDLVQKFLVFKASERLGADDPVGCYSSVRSHPFLKSIDITTLYKQTPPQMQPQALHRELTPVNWDEIKSPGLENIDLIIPDLDNVSMFCPTDSTVPIGGTGGIADIAKEEFDARLDLQKKNNSEWHKFVGDNLILKQGILIKRKGLFPRKRMFLLTTGPHLYYIDPATMILKGEVPLSSSILPEPKNFKTFFVHTPNRTYNLEDPNESSGAWCQAIREVRSYYFGDPS